MGKLLPGAAAASLPSAQTTSRRSRADRALARVERDCPRISRYVDLMLESSPSSMPADFRTSFPMPLQARAGAPTQNMASGEPLNGCSHQNTYAPGGLSPCSVPGTALGASPIIEAIASQKPVVHCSISQHSTWDWGAVSATV